MIFHQNSPKQKNFFLLLWSNCTNILRSTWYWPWWLLYCNLLFNNMTDDVWSLELYLMWSCRHILFFSRIRICLCWPYRVTLDITNDADSSHWRHTCSWCHVKPVTGHFLKDISCLFVFLYTKNTVKEAGNMWFSAGFTNMSDHPQLVLNEW